jgi:hypothetical protein
MSDATTNRERRRNRYTALALALVALLLFAAGAFLTLLWPPTREGLQGYPIADSQSFDRIERGRYLAVLGDCAACHTAPGGKPFAGGLALETPFGKLLAPNITPDRETGIGAWTDGEFLAAMHDGRGRDGRFLYPAMPYPAYTKMTRDDVLLIRSYLATVEPVSNAVVVNQLPFPFNIRESLFLESPQLHARPLSGRPAEIGGVESRRLYRRGRRPLRRLPYAEELARRRQKRKAACRRDLGGMVRPQHHGRSAQGHRQLVA